MKVGYRKNWSAWIAFRYLRSKKSSKFLNLITLLSVMGVGVGVAAMIVVLCVMDGFEGELKKRLIGSDLHVRVDVLHPAELSQELAQKAEEQIRNQTGVTEVFGVQSVDVILKVNRKVTGIVAKGVTELRMRRMEPELVEKVEPPFDRPLEDIVMGRELAFDLGVIPGDEVTLISPTETQGPMGSIPKFRKFKVSGIYRTGVPDQELKTLYLDQRALEAFFRRPTQITHWEVVLKDLNDASKVASTLQANLGPSFSVKDWNQMNASLFFSLRLERFGMFLVLGFIVIVASFNIVTTLSLLVIEKKSEIAILKTLGARAVDIGRIYLYEGLAIGGIGTIGGTILAAIIAVILDNADFIELPDIYYDQTLPVNFNIGYFVGIPVTALLIVLLACLYPAKKASQLHPIEAIRDA